MQRLRQAYLVPSVLEFTGTVDHTLLVESVQRVLGRHPALRSRFRFNPKLRRVEYRTDGDPISVGFIDAVADEWSDEELARLVELLCHTSFDLANEPPGRAEVIRVEEKTTLLVLTVHHIVFDGWSRQVLVRELAEVYRAGASGLVPDLAEPVHPAEVAAPLSPADTEEVIARVVRRLDGAPDGFRLPYRATEWSSLGGNIRSWIDPDLAGSLTAVALSERCTIFMAVVALLAAALARTCGQHDLLLGFPWTGREDPATQHAVGMFVNMSVLRITVDEGMSWRELLRRTRRAAMEGYRDAAAPFDAVTAAVNPARALAKSPLTPVIVSVQESAPLPDLADGVAARDIPTETRHIKYELALFANLDSASGGIELSLDYPADLFDRTDMDGIIAEIRRCVVRLAHDSEAPVLDKDGFSLDDPAARLDLVRTAWREVLDVEDVDDDVNFFDAGGNSLLVIMLVERLNELSGRELDSADIFETDTIKGQADLLTADEAATSAAPRELGRDQLLDLARRRGGRPQSERGD